MRKYLKKIGVNFEENEECPPEVVKTPEELDLENAVKFAEKMRSISQKLESCKTIKERLTSPDDSRYSIMNYYSEGWKVSLYKLELAGLDMDEIYYFIYSKVKEKEEELKALLKEYTKGCVKCELSPQ